MAESEYLTVSQVVDRYPLGRSKLYELVGAGEVQSFNLGRRRVIVRGSLDAYLARLAAAA